jgi:AmmeMemoRadiSam system protein B
MGKALMLRDTQGVAPSHAVLPVEFVPIVSRMDGRRTCEEIAKQVTGEIRERVPVDLVVRLATELETAMFIEGAPYRRERDRIEREFADSSVRPASHAGGAYHDDPKKLAAYIDDECLARARKAKKATNGTGALRALIAPHIDPWRGARCYGHAYSTLRATLPDDVQTFVLFGTSHAPMRTPFAICRKAFATPLGSVEADLEAIDRIASAAKKDFDVYGDQFNHKREHSLEFQAVFLRHLLGPREARIVPILAGLGAQQQTGKSPALDAACERFLAEVRAVVEEKNAVVIAGADLAHVGPRFGDLRPYTDRQRVVLDETDRTSLDHAERAEPEAFWAHVAKDLDTRRVCGLGPIYSLLRTMNASAKGKLVHYEQTVDSEEGSIVSHAAMGFYD